jgi:hypothetical protein
MPGTWAPMSGDAASQIFWRLYGSALGAKPEASGKTVHSWLPAAPRPAAASAVDQPGPARTLTSCVSTSASASTPYSKSIMQ